MGKYFTVHYRRMESSDSQHSLEEIVRAALQETAGRAKIMDLWTNRVWQDTSVDDSDMTLMNYSKDLGHINKGYFGDLTIYSGESMQSFLESIPDKAILPVVQDSPPQNLKFIRATMYWLIIKNHVLIIPRRSISIKQFEKYLTWLLKDKTKKVSTEIELISHFDLDEVGGHWDDIRKITIGGAVARDTVQHFDLERRKIVDWSMAGKILEVLLGGKAYVDEVLNEVPPDADLDVSVSVGYKTYRRKIEKNPLKKALRNLPEGEIKVLGKNGIATKNDIRLNRRVYVQCDNDLVNLEDVCEKLYTVFSYFTKSGKIPK